jgi:secreted trypsin-like serine protease
MTRWLALFAALTMSCSEAPASEQGRRELSLLGGSADAHEAVVSITTVPEAARAQLCTGVVVAPRLVITAGHCTIGRTPDELIVGVGPKSRTPTATLKVASVHTLPRYRYLRADDLRGLDLGALVLVDDAPVAPIAISRTAPATTAVAVGFGQTSTDPETRGSRTSGTVPIVAACSTLLTFGDATTNACHGDSGGPLLVKDASGLERVAAIVSYGTEACDAPTHAVRLDAYAAWIDRVAAGAPDDTCATCPPPGDDCLEEPADAAPVVDAAPSPAPTANGDSCAYGARGGASPLLLLALLVVTRTCGAACSRSSRGRCRSAPSSRSTRRS